MSTIFRTLLEWYPVLTETITDVSNDRSAFIFKAKNAPVFLYCLTLMMKETWYFKTSVPIHQSPRVNTTEDLNLQLYPCKKSSLANLVSFYVVSHRTHWHILSARNASRNSSGTRHTRFSPILPHFLKRTDLVTVLLTNVRHSSSIDWMMITCPKILTA
jgi:hypothetical protein